MVFEILSYSLISSQSKILTIGPYQTIRTKICVIHVLTEPSQSPLFGTNFAFLFYPSFRIWGLACTIKTDLIGFLPWCCSSHVYYPITVFLDVIVSIISFYSDPPMLNRIICSTSQNIGYTSEDPTIATMQNPGSPNFDTNNFFILVLGGKCPPSVLIDIFAM